MSSSTDWIYDDDDDDDEFEEYVEDDDDDEWEDYDDGEEGLDWDNMSPNEQHQFIEEGKEIMRNVDPDQIREIHADTDWVDEVADVIEDYQNSPSPGFYPADPSESGHYPDGDSGWDDDPELR